MQKKTGLSKAFDSVAFKRQAQASIYRNIKDMSPAREISYFEKRAEEGKLGDWWKQVKATGSSSVAPKRLRRSA